MQILNYLLIKTIVESLDKLKAKATRVFMNLLTIRICFIQTVIFVRSLKFTLFYNVNMLLKKAI